jgi:hypothetical protein
MANTYTLISSITVGAGGAASMSFTSIPATYSDLIVVWSGRTSSGQPTTNTEIFFNGSGANFSNKYLEGNGTGFTGSGTYPRFIGTDSAATSTGSVFSNNMVYIPNYAGSNNKSFSADSVAENNAVTTQQTFNAGLWSQSAAITSVTITPATSSYVQYSTAYLYGISNA